MQGTKASFQLASADDQAWWVDTTTVAGAIMHRILFDKDAQANGMAPGPTAMDLIVGKGAGAGAKAGHTDFPDTRAKLKALSAKGCAQLENFIAEADAPYRTDQTGRSVAILIYTTLRGLALQHIDHVRAKPIANRNFSSRNCHTD